MCGAVLRALITCAPFERKVTVQQAGLDAEVGDEDGKTGVGEHLKEVRAGPEMYSESPVPPHSHFGYRSLQFMYSVHCTPIDRLKFALFLFYTRQ